MAHFAYRHSDLCCEQVSLRSLVADVGTPAYVYSKAALLESYRGYDDAFAEVPHVVCYSAKRSEEHTSELQSLTNLVCRLLLEKKNQYEKSHTAASAFVDELSPPQHSPRESFL